LIISEELNVPETNQMNSLPLWVDNIACHEAERIYEMMPSMFGEKAQVIARLEAGIIELLSNEISKRAT
jgi:hypothetical protein